jgi:hypothetical protein
MFIATCGNDDHEAALVEWQIKRANGFKRQSSALSGASGQMPPGFHEWLTEVSHNARRTINAAADVENRHGGGDPGRLGKFDGRSENAGVKLVGAQLPGHARLAVRPEGRERRLQPLRQPSRAIAIGYAIKSIGHCELSREFSCATHNVRRFQRRTIRDNVNAL